MDASGNGDSSELIAVDIGDAIEPGESFVDRDEVRLDHLPGIEVVLQELGEVRLRLADHRGLQMSVVLGKEILGGRIVPDIAQPQPLPGEVLHERLRTRVGQQAIDLSLPHLRIAQLA